MGGEGGIRLYSALLLNGLKWLKFVGSLCTVQVKKHKLRGSKIIENILCLYIKHILLGGWVDHSTINDDLI